MYMELYNHSKFSTKTTRRKPSEYSLYKEYVRLVLNHFIKFEKQNSELLYVTPH